MSGTERWNSTSPVELINNTYADNRVKCVTFNCAYENEDGSKGKRPGFKFHMNEPQRKVSALGVGLGVPIE